MMSRSIARRIWPLFAGLVAGLFVLAAPARADVFDLGRYDFTAGEEPGVYQLAVSLPQAVAPADAAGVIGWPVNCKELSHDRQIAGGRVQLSYEISCGRGLGRDDLIRTPWIVDGASFTSTASGHQVERVLQADDAGVVLPVGDVSEATERPFAAVAADYSWQGILHILGGWDHLAFVLCLCLLARGRELLALVTTFTAGHSISLGLAFFDVIHVPVPPVEAVIALSIAFMAREALIARSVAASVIRPRYLAVVGSFGLLHGLGFATALSELGVAARERVEGLVFFNVGVEIGQLMFVTVVVGLMALARAAGRAEPVRVAALYGAGALGCFWMVERVAGFGQLAA
jgi:hypothetical protein